MVDLVKDNFNSPSIILYYGARSNIILSRHMLNFCNKITKPVC